MKTAVSTSKPSLLSLHRHQLFVLAAWGVLLLAVFLRLYGLDSLVLADDEWHSLFRVQEAGYRFIFSHFGTSDHSIPLTLLNEWLSRHFVLNEWGMRLPSLFASLALIALTLIYLRRTPRLALLFALLLATSPFLIYFAQIARPYSLSLLFSYSAIVFFIIYWKERQSTTSLYRAYAFAFLYALCAVLSVWLLLPSAFFIIAPFLYYLLNLRHPQTFWKTLRTFLIPGLMFTFFFFLLLTPALLTSWHELSIKTSLGHIPTFLTYFRLPFLYFGSVSNILVVIMLLAAGTGIILAWKTYVFLRIASLGCISIILMIYFSHPNYSFNTVTFGRYIIFALPLLLFGIAYSLDVIIEKIQQHFSASMARILSCSFLSILACGFFFFSTLSQRFLDPSYISNHSFFYFDPDLKYNNAYHATVFAYPTHNDFWETIVQKGDHIAVAPFSFETHYWFAPLWLRDSRAEAIIPVLLNPFCLPEHALGEAWYDAQPQIHLRNVLYLQDMNSTPPPELDWFVWFKNATQFEDFYLKPYLSTCETAIRDVWGPPDYEDSEHQAWRIPRSNP